MAAGDRRARGRVVRPGETGPAEPTRARDGARPGRTLLLKRRLHVKGEKGPASTSTCRRSPIVDVRGCSGGPSASGGRPRRGSGGGVRHGGGWDRFPSLDDGSVSKSNHGSHYSVNLYTTVFYVDICICWTRHMLQENFPVLLRGRRPGASRTWRWRSTAGARLRRDPVSRRDPAGLRLVRDGLTGGQTAATNRRMHSCSPAANRLERRRIPRVADRGKDGPADPERSGGGQPTPGTEAARDTAWRCPVLPLRWSLLPAAFRSQVEGRLPRLPFRGSGHPPAPEPRFSTRGSVPTPRGVRPPPDWGSARGARREADRCGCSRSSRSSGRARSGARLPRTPRA